MNDGLNSGRAGHPMTGQAAKKGPGRQFAERSSPENAGHLAPGEKRLVRAKHDHLPPQGSVTAHPDGEKWRFPLLTPQPTAFDNKRVTITRFFLFLRDAYLTAYLAERDDSEERLATAVSGGQM